MQKAAVILSPCGSHQLTCHLQLLLCDCDNPLTLAAAKAACACCTEPSAVIHVHAAVARRRSFGGVHFVDLVDGDSQAAPSSAPLQLVVEPSRLQRNERVHDPTLGGLALPLLLRRHSVLAIAGVAGVTRSGQRSLFARSLRLLSLPPDPAAILKAARLVASTTELPAVVAADALGCSSDELYAIVHSIEAAEAVGDDGAEDEAHGTGEAHPDPDPQLSSPLPNLHFLSVTVSSPVCALPSLRGRRHTPPLSFVGSATAPRAACLLACLRRPSSLNDAQLDRQAPPPRSPSTLQFRRAPAA